ncbi:hypothetical protein DFR58_1591 [Anaerobacterium chartisolvens]|uniref:Uncharacterized protein n=1 Tax=Anaerobacterium chartisolvens TaxID=1297424 RepID=A0A369AG45_9FIRM|nr:hypothetical protein [Anaerobacterium chartisolvens]RCX07127.1 hypothetical protein DFR58_1591 [Anaerobacterium chartisolvens]
MKDRIKKILAEELGYTPYEAEVTADGLMRLDMRLKAAFDRWLCDRTETDVGVVGLNAFKLMEKRGLAYPAALISLDWAIREPEQALEFLKHGSVM